MMDDRFNNNNTNNNNDTKLLWCAIYERNDGLEPFHKSQFSSLRYIGYGKKNWEDRREDKRNMTKDGSWPDVPLPPLPSTLLPPLIIYLLMRRMWKGMLNFMIASRDSGKKGNMRLQRKDSSNNDLLALIFPFFFSLRWADEWQAVYFINDDNDHIRPLSILSSFLYHLIFLT